MKRKVTLLTMKIAEIRPKSSSSKSRAFAKVRLSSFKSCWFSYIANKEENEREYILKTQWHFSSHMPSTIFETLTAFVILTAKEISTLEKKIVDTLFYP